MWERALRESPKTSLPTKQKEERRRPEAHSFGSGVAERDTAYTRDMAIDRAKTGISFFGFDIESSEKCAVLAIPE